MEKDETGSAPKAEEKKDDKSLAMKANTELKLIADALK